MQPKSSSKRKVFLLVKRVVSVVFNGISRNGKHRETLNFYNWERWMFFCIRIILGQQNVRDARGCAGGGGN